MQRRRLTIAEIARHLEVPEAKVKAFKRDGMLEPVGKGRHGAELFDLRDVDSVGRRVRLGHYQRESRRILVVGQLDRQVLALTAAGLDVKRADTLMDALTQHEQPGMPIVVLPPPYGVHEAVLLETIIDSVYCILVGHKSAVPPITRRRSIVVDPEELRELVSQAWRSVEIRIEQVELKL